MTGDSLSDTIAEGGAMEDSQGCARPVHLLELRCDDVLIDRLAVAPLHEEPAIEDGCGGELIGAIMAWRRWMELDR
ncbi:hypothetical protein [Pseudonocardia sp. GCM10023141]|uniref:hypothetical protein n=1 Tax=Pseudonocardia sp. GCM10023141 TaxID=3252653 RepID=UPI00361FF5A1